MRVLRQSQIDQFVSLPLKVVQAKNSRVAVARKLG
jgi:hypothetical protein